MTIPCTCVLGADECSPTQCLKIDYNQIGKKWNIRVPVDYKVTSGERVDHPAHYGGADNPYEVIRVLEQWLTREEFIGALKFNIHKYTARAANKNGPEDYAKAQWHAKYLVEFLQRNPEDRRPETLDLPARPEILSPQIFWGRYGVQFRGLPMKLRQRWWSETDYARKSPSEALVKEIEKYRQAEA